MATASSIITRALRIAGVVDTIETPSAAELSAGLDSLNDALATIAGYAASIAGFIADTIGKLAKQFLQMTTTVLGVVSRVMGTLKGAVPLTAAMIEDPSMSQVVGIRFENHCSGSGKCSRPSRTTSSRQCSSSSSRTTS